MHQIFNSNPTLNYLLDILVKPFCETVSRFITVDLDFLNRASATMDENTTLVAFDVVSLYTNIPMELGIEAVKLWTEKTYSMIVSHKNLHFKVEDVNEEMMRLTIFYKQRGTAMGTTVAPI